MQPIKFFSNGRSISGVFRTPDPSQPQPCVVINHGYSGYKEEYDDLAQYLNAEGFSTLQFDSRGCGESEAPLGRMLCSTEWVEDADAAVTLVSNLPEVDPSRIGYTGCSMGGVLSLKAASDPRVRAVAAMAAFSDGRQMLEEVWALRRGWEAWEAFLQEVESDAADVARGRPSRVVSVPYALSFLDADRDAYEAERLNRPGIVTKVPLESVRNSFLNFRTLDFAPSIQTPVMLLHGTWDSIVPPHHAQDLYDCLRADKEYVKLPHAPHGIPLWERKNDAFTHVVRWFKRFLT